MRVAIAAILLVIGTIIAPMFVIAPVLIGDRHPPVPTLEFYFDSWQLKAALVSWFVACVLFAGLIVLGRYNLVLVTPIVWFIAFIQLWLGAVDQIRVLPEDPDPCHLTDRIVVHSTTPPLPVQPTFTWCVDFGDDPVSRPIVNGDLLIARRANHDLVALDLATGQERWSVKANHAFGLHVVTDDLVLVVDGRQLVALDRVSGVLRWQRELTDAVEAQNAPVVCGTLTYIVTTTGRIQAFNLGTGQPQWQVQLGTYPNWSANWKASDDTLVYLGRVKESTSQSELVAINTRSGTLLWRQIIETGRDSRALTIGNGVVIDWSGQDMTAREIETGRVLWRVTIDETFLWTPLITSDLLVNGVRFKDESGITHGQVLAFDLKTGQTKWQTPLPSKARSFWEIDGYIYVDSDSSRIHVLDRITGEEIRSYDSHQVLYDYCQMLAAREELLIACPNVSAIDRTSGTLLWSIHVEEPGHIIDAPKMLIVSSRHGIYRVDLLPTVLAATSTP